MRDRHTYERSRVINRIRLLMGAGWWMQMLEQLHPSDTVFDMRERADGCRCIHPSYVPDSCLVLCCQLSSSSPLRHESGAAGAEVAVQGPIDWGG